MTRALVALLALFATGCSHVVWYGRSDDRRHSVAVLEEAGRQRVRFDMKDGPAVRGVGVDALVLTDDGHVIYPAELDDGWALLVDGVAGPAFDGIGEVKVSGTHVVYSAERNGKWLVLRSGHAGPPPRAWDEVLAGSLSVSKTGRVAFAAREGLRVFAVIDDVPSEPFDGLGQLQFSPDGQRVGFVARTRGEQSLIIDGRTQGPFEAVTDLKLGTPDVFAMQREGRWHVVSDGAESEPFDRVAGLSVSAGRAAFAGKLGATTWVMDGARKVGPFDRVTSALMRDEEGRIVFTAQAGEERVLVVGEAQHAGAWTELQAPVIAGTHVGVIATDGAGKAHVLIDGVERSTWEWADSLTLSPDGTRVAHLAADGNATALVLDGKAQRMDVVVAGTLAFSRDGKRFGCVIGERKTKRLFIQRDDGRRVPVDMEELVAALSRFQSEALLTAPDVALLRRWVEAELHVP